MTMERAWGPPEGDNYHATRTGLPEDDNYHATRTGLPWGNPWTGTKVETHTGKSKAAKPAPARARPRNPHLGEAGVEGTNSKPDLACYLLRRAGQNSFLACYLLRVFLSLFNLANPTPASCDGPLELNKYFFCYGFSLLRT